jgi:hypothetical protein
MTLSGRMPSKSKRLIDQFRLREPRALGLCPSGSDRPTGEKLSP